MTYPPAQFHDSTGAVSAQFRSSDVDPDLAMQVGVDVSFVLTSAQTNGEFGLYRWDTGEQPVEAFPHFHRGMSETFFVLSGIVTLHDGTGTREAGPGDSLFVPKGGIHGFRNSHGPASMLILFTPGAPREAYFRALADRIDGRVTYTTEEWAALCAECDQFAVS